MAEIEHSTDVHLSRSLHELDGLTLSMTTTARLDGRDGSWVINGHKMMPSCASTPR